MNKIKSVQHSTGRLLWPLTLLFSILVSGCDGEGGEGRDAILGTAKIANLGPTVSAVAPLDGALAVPTNTKNFTAAFNEDMDAASLTAANVKLECPLGTPIAGAVSYLSAGFVATLTLPLVPDLPPSTLCTATITSGVKDVTGTAMASDYTWSFTTGLTPDTIRPQVTITTPATTTPGPTLNVPTTTLISAVFSEDMVPSTINAASFTVTCAAPCISPTGIASYAVGSKTAVFTPTSALTNGATYTVTLTTAATDLANNTLAGNQGVFPAASNYVWSFTTEFLIPTVTAVTPVANSTDVPINTKIITASFSADMSVIPMTNANFKIDCPTGTPFTGVVSYQSLGSVATLTLPAVPDLPPSVTCTVTITTAMEDTLGTNLGGPVVRSFTTGLIPDNTRPQVTSTAPITTIPGPTLNVMPNNGITATFSESMDAATINNASFTEFCLKRILANEKQLTLYVEQSLMLVTALTPIIGYDKTAQTAKFAFENELSLKEAILQLGFISAEAFDKALANLRENSIHPH